MRIDICDTNTQKKRWCSNNRTMGNVVGIVTKRRGHKVFVVWEGTSFHIEDEMDIKEVRPDDGVEINKK